MYVSLRTHLYNTINYKYLYRNFHDDHLMCSMQGIVTRCLLPEAGVYELDGGIALYLTHTGLSNLGRGLRVGAEVEVNSAHLLKIAAKECKVSNSEICDHICINHPYGTFYEF